MKRIILLLVFMVFLIFLASQLPAAPYAPVVPRGAHVKVPDLSDVEIPPYPGAQVYRVVPGVGGKLPSMSLLSPDPPEKVLSFYEERLKEWKKGPLLEGWALRKKPFTRGPMGMGPGIHILPAAPDMGTVMPGVKAHIQIWYGTPE